METRIMKILSKNGSVPLKLIYGHFATNHSHINCYLDMTTLKELAKKMLAGPKDYVYTITGYADFTTGARSNNISIAERRAKSVYDYLVEQGVNPDQLTWKGVGSTQNIFPINGTNRVVIVK